jgi:hypothetical protein
VEISPARPFYQQINVCFAFLSLYVVGVAALALHQQFKVLSLYNSALRGLVQAMWMFEPLSRGDGYELPFFCSV